MTRDYYDPDDLPGLADVDGYHVDEHYLSTGRIPRPVMGPPRRDRWNLPTPDVLGQHISLDIATRLLTGESVVLGPGVTPADIAAGRVVEIPFPFQPQPQEPTMHPETSHAADPAMVPDDPHDAGNVTVATRRITNELDGLDRLLEALADRLGDGLRDADPGDVRPAAATPGGMAPLACRLHTVADRLDDVNGRLARILDRIDL